MITFSMQRYNHVYRTPSINIYITQPIYFSYTLMCKGLKWPIPHEYGNTLSTMAISLPLLVGKGKEDWLGVDMPRMNIPSS